MDGIVFRFPDNGSIAFDCEERGGGESAINRNAKNMDNYKGEPITLRNRFFTRGNVSCCFVELFFVCLTPLKLNSYLQEKGAIDFVLTRSCFENLLNRLFKV